MRGLPERTKAAFVSLAAVSAVIFLTGCQSLDEIAPPVATVSSRPSGRLALGRELYVTKCAKCHAPEPILRYTRPEWEDIVADMAEETKLTAHETAAVRDYVMAVLANAAVSEPSAR